jgi:hypothetical protein
VSGVRQDTPKGKGTAVKKISQIQPVGAIPERVSVAMTEIIENMQGGLLALAVGAGLQAMTALIDADVTACRGIGAAAKFGGTRDILGESNL